MNSERQPIRETSHRQSSDTGQIIELLEGNKDYLIDKWVDDIRVAFQQSEKTSDRKLADDIMVVLEVLIVELKKFESESGSDYRRDGTLSYEDGIIVDKDDGGKEHGKQRAEINAYKADKVYWEYVLLRKIIIDFIQERLLLDIDHLELITCVIESCTRDSLFTFTQSLERIQRTLLGSLIHDIRNPLNVISMSGDLITSTDDIELIKKYGKKLCSASERISVMLEDMLQTISFEGGQGLDLYFQRDNLVPHLERLATDSEALYGPRFKLVCQSNDITSIFDASAVLRILENLVSNAFKYGDLDSEITVTAKEQDEDVIVSVHNYGPPIATERWDEIFVFLKRFEGRESNRKKSWGIGLAIAKAAAQGHKGRIELKSDLEQGTTFKLILPKNQLAHDSSITVEI